jgi:hypothetical protein
MFWLVSGYFTAAYNNYPYIAQTLILESMTAITTIMHPIKNA